MQLAWFWPGKEAERGWAEEPAVLPGTRSEGTLPSSRGVGGDVQGAVPAGGAGRDALCPTHPNPPRSARPRRDRRRREKVPGRGAKENTGAALSLCVFPSPQFSWNSPRLSPAPESGREAAACAVPEPRALRAARGGAPTAPSALRGVPAAATRSAAPGARRALGAGPAPASRWRGKHMDSPGSALRSAFPGITVPGMSRINQTAATAAQARGVRDAPRRRKVFQPPRSAQSPAASERGSAASQERGLTWG